MRAALVCAVLAACGGGRGNPDAAAIGDGAACGRTWRFELRDGSSIARFDPAPVNSARTVRVRVGIDLAPCEELGMPRTARAFEQPDVQIQLGVFVPMGAPCTGAARHVERPIALVLETPATWTIRTGTQTLSIDVGAAPTRGCGTTGACEMDCDCTGGGERCLGGYGLGGPFTACARPCEFDRDCGGEGTCESVPDGLDSTCQIGVPECPTHACPSGYTCASNACVSDAQLGQATRVECACDADCAAPLRCVESARPDRKRRCEITCPTDGWWCTTQHFCGLAEMDTAGLAPSDSVCVWAGE